MKKTQKMETMTYSIIETAQILGIGKTLCYEQARSGQIPAKKIGERYVVPKVLLERFLSLPDSPQFNQN